MRKFIILLLILFVSPNLFSQDDYVKLLQAKTQNPCYIINKNVIGNEYLIKSLATSEEELKEKIDEMYVLINKGDRESNRYYNLTEHGILLVDLKVSIASKTQSELKKFFGLGEHNEMYIDGYLLENKNYRIALTGITEIEIIEPDNANGLKNKALNIWTLSKNERYCEETH